MRTLGIITLLLLLAVPAIAQNPSSNTTFTIRTERPRADIEIGAAEFNTHAARIRIAYLPRLAPLPGTFPTRSWGQLPNPLELTRTEIPERPRQMPAYIVVR